MPAVNPLDTKYAWYMCYMGGALSSPWTTGIWCVWYKRSFMFISEKEKLNWTVLVRNLFQDCVTVIYPSYSWELGYPNHNLVQNVVQTHQFVSTIEYNQPTQNNVNLKLRSTEY